MRTTIFLFSFVALSLGLQGQQTLNVTPQTLAGWSVIGADPQALSKQPALTLPAGAQLVRSFRTTGVALRVTTTPIIGLSADDWPVLEVGNAALLFARNGSSGKLVLVVGDNAPVDLPLNFALDADGVSVEPVTVSFSRQGAVVSVGISGRTVPFPAPPVAGDSLEIVASAGIAMPWSIDALDVTTEGPGTTGSTGGRSTAGASSTATGSKFTAKDGSAAPGAGRGALTSSLTSAGGKTTQTTADAPRSKATLEIFTPPAVRRSRAAVVRAAAQPNGN